VDTLIQQAIAALDADDVDRARNILSQAVRRDPQHGQAWYLLGKTKTLVDVEQKRECETRAKALGNAEPPQQTTQLKVQSSVAQAPVQTARAIPPAHPSSGQKSSPNGTKESAGEIMLYSDRSVVITTTRAVFGAKTYAMSNIASITMGTKSSNVGLLFGILLFLMGLMCIAINNHSLMSIVFGLTFLGCGGLILYSLKTTYVVRIASTSGEADALLSKDEAYIRRIVSAANEAIIERG
jgi:hypothetical protein